MVFQIETLINHCNQIMMRIILWMSDIMNFVDASPLHTPQKSIRQCSFHSLCFSISVCSLIYSPNSCKFIRLISRWISLYLAKCALFPLNGSVTTWSPDIYTQHNRCTVNCYYYCLLCTMISLLILSLLFRTQRRREDTKSYGFIMMFVVFAVWLGCCEMFGGSQSYTSEKLFVWL